MTTVTANSTAEGTDPHCRPWQKPVIELKIEWSCKPFCCNNCPLAFNTFAFWLFFTGHYCCCLPVSCPWPLSAIIPWESSFLFFFYFFFFLSCMWFCSNTFVLLPRHHFCIHCVFLLLLLFTLLPCATTPLTGTSVVPDKPQHFSLSPVNYPLLGYDPALGFSKPMWININR